MGNLAKHKDTWARYRRAVDNANRERDRALEALEGYEGERAEREREMVEMDYRDAIGAAREEARSEFNVTIGNMRRKAASVGEVMEGPTHDQLNLLKMLEMRKTISPSEAQSAARALAGCDSALATLAELCQTRGGAIVPEIAGAKTNRQKAHDALREFEDAATICLSWTGGNRAELLSTRLRQQTAHVPASSRVSMDAVIAADIDAEHMQVADYISKIVGHNATAEGAQMID